MLTTGLWLVAFEVVAVGACLPPALMTDGDRGYKALIAAVGAGVLAGCVGWAMIAVSAAAAVTRLL